VEPLLRPVLNLADRLMEKSPEIATVVDPDEKVDITIGIATFDDFDGAWFTINSLHLHHQDVMDRAEVVLLDNHPRGPESAELKRFETQLPRVRYVPVSAYSSTAIRDQIFARKLEQPTGFGRIYRIMHDTTKLDTTRTLAHASPAELVETLSHPNGWRRDTAQRLLVERGAKAVVTALVKLAEHAKDPRTRLHALWTLDGVDAIQPATVIKALEDESRDVRISAIRIAERWMGDANHPIQAAVLKRMDDSDRAVHQQLAASLGALPSGPRETAAVALLERYADDPVVMDAALSGLRGSEAIVLDRLLASKPPNEP